MLRYTFCNKTKRGSTMKTILLTLLLTFSLSAYNKGDMIDKEMLQTLKLQKDKLYIIDFFASWCGSCKKELPLIAKVNTQIDKSKVEILGIDVDSKLSKAVAFQKKMRASGAMNFTVINDTDNKIIRNFKAVGMPSLYYVKNGKVLDIIIGAVHNIDAKILSDIKKF